MYPVEKTNLISCQITYFPIDSKEYLDEINQVLELIKKSGLDYDIGMISTTIKGDSEKVFSLITNIHKRMSSGNCNYTMNVMISNICGCEI